MRRDNAAVGLLDRELRESPHDVDLEHGAPFSSPSPNFLVAPSNPALYLLLCTPLGVAAHALHWSPLLCFLANFFPLIPLAYLLAEAAQQASCFTGSTVGGLITATFGNAPELVLACTALRREKVELVQASLVGSILSTLVLMTGVCLFFGGIYHKDQQFNTVSVAANSSLLMIACMALSLPTMYVYLVPGTHNDLKMSYAAAVALAVSYIQFIFYQTSTHGHLFQDCDVPPEKPKFGLITLLSVMAALTACMALHSELLVDAVEGTVASTGVNERFIGVILLPIVGNGAEHVVALMAAVQNRMSLAIGIAFASCTQIALFVVPSTVAVGYLLGVRMDLSFHVFEVVAIHLSLLIVAELTRAGSGSWVQGSLLLTTYALLSFGFYFLPDSPAAAPRL